VHPHLWERLPVSERLIPIGPLRSEASLPQISECRFIRRNHAGPSTRFDAHVAEGHPAFHRKLSDRLARVLDHVSGSAVGANLADDPSARSFAVTP